jgi:hypothetical protein
LGADSGIQEEKGGKTAIAAGKSSLTTGLFRGRARENRPKTPQTPPFRPIFPLKYPFFGKMPLFSKKKRKIFTSGVKKAQKPPGGWQNSPSGRAL